MWKIKRILCPIDFSEFSVKALDYAQSLARHYDARLLLQHVIQPVLYDPSYSFAPGQSAGEILNTFRSDAELRMGELLKVRVPSGVQTECIFDDGFPTHCILDLAERESVDLIVMGTHGLRGFDRMMMGSAAAKVLRKARCPVLTVRKPAHDFVDCRKQGDAVQLRKILFCTDFSGYADRALQYALSLASEYKSELTLLHIADRLPHPKEQEATRQQIQDQLEKSISPELRARCAIQSRVRVGKPYEQIVQTASEEQSDLIVMGVLGRDALDLIVFGSVTERVIQSGPCPVLAVRG